MIEYIYSTGISFYPVYCRSVDIFYNFKLYTEPTLNYKYYKQILGSKRQKKKHDNQVKLRLVQKLKIAVSSVPAENTKPWVDQLSVTKNLWIPKNFFTW